jgi:hypothetical protein
MSEPVVWADQSYLRDVQYRDSGRLAARASLHGKYGRDDWASWIAGQRTWRAGEAVLAAGGGILTIHKNVGLFVCGTAG